MKIWQCLWAVISDAARSLLRSHLSSFAKNLLTTGAMDAAATVEPSYKAAWRKADQPLTGDQLFGETGRDNIANPISPKMSWQT